MSGVWVASRQIQPKQVYIYVCFGFGGTNLYPFPVPSCVGHRVCRVSCAALFFLSSLGVVFCHFSVTFCRLSALVSRSCFGRQNLPRVVLTVATKRTQLIQRPIVFFVWILVNGLRSLGLVLEMVSVGGAYFVL